MMKTNYLTAVALGLLAALCGCQAEDDTSHTPQGNIPIGFSSDVPGTRATKEYGSAADLTDMGVFAYFTNGMFNQSSSTPNFMYNQKVERQADGSWTYAPVKYWPGNTTDRLTFFAYAPYVDETATGGSNPSFQGRTAAGFPKLTYTVPAVEADQTDLLAATPLMNRTAPTTGSEKVTFSLKHALSKVNIGIKSEVGITVTALSVNKVPATATLTFTNSGFTWGGYTGTETVTATLANGTVAANTADAQKVATFYLLPQKASATLSIAYTQAGTPSMQFTRTDIAFPSTATAWEPGVSLGYTLHVKKDGKVTATVGQDWSSESGGDMSGQEKGINSIEEWMAFTKLWNANGLPTLSDGVTPDYSLYEKYGWYETDGANRTFTIKLTASFVLTGTKAGELYAPVGTDAHPLTLPIDGQGWEISIDLQNSSQLIEGKYSGVVGYTRSGISNLRVKTLSGISSTTGYSIESSGATYAGVLAGRADGDILNCSVELNKTTVVNSNASAAGAMYLGGLAGYCGGNILNSAVFEGSTSKVSFSQASAGSGIGGLAGGVASGKRVENCYVQLSELSNQAGNTPAAGCLAGSKPGVGFNACHYKSGNTASGCTPNDPLTGITSFADFTGLCALLNAEAGKHTGWALWKEVKNTEGSVKQVALDLYR